MLANKISIIGFNPQTKLTKQTKLKAKRGRPRKDAPSHQPMFIKSTENLPTISFDLNTYNQYFPQKKQSHQKKRKRKEATNYQSCFSLPTSPQQHRQNTNHLGQSDKLPSITSITCDIPTLSSSVAIGCSDINTGHCRVVGSVGRFEMSNRMVISLLFSQTMK